MNFLCSDAFLTLATVNIEEVVAFYTAFLGREPVQSLGSIYAEFQLPGLRLAIFKPAANQQEFQVGKSGMSLCLEVNSLENAISRLEAIGCQPPGGILTASHGREIYAYDPAGNRLILHQKHVEDSNST